ncbi:zinc finger domain-containing protein [Mycolicibacterium sp. A43C]
MSIPEVVSPPAQTAAMTLPATASPALKVPCPICDAQADESCMDSVRGWLRPVAQPHLYRITIAEEAMR